MSLINFIEEIYSRLASSTTANVYLEQAPSNASFPYITYNINNSVDQEVRRDFILEINAWDSCEDNNTVELEDITNDLDDGLNEWKYVDDSMHISVYRESRGMIPDPDESIRRRRLTYTCKTWQ